MNDPPNFDELKKYRKLQEEETCKKLSEKLTTKSSQSKISFEELMKTWQKEQKELYTWDKLLSALRNIGEKNLAHDIMGKVNSSICYIVTVDIDKFVEHPDEETQAPLISPSRYLL